MVLSLGYVVSKLSSKSGLTLVSYPAVRTHLFPRLMDFFFNVNWLTITYSFYLFVLKTIIVFKFCLIYASFFPHMESNATVKFHLYVVSVYLIHLLSALLCTCPFSTPFIGCFNILGKKECYLRARTRS